MLNSDMCLAYDNNIPQTWAESVDGEGDKGRYVDGWSPSKFSKFVISKGEKPRYNEVLPKLTDIRKREKVLHGAREGYG